MPELKDVIKVNSSFQNAINLYLDLNKTDKITSYLSTKSSVDILDMYLKSVEENIQQATLLVGPYGKGKSHLLLLLLAILSLERNEENKRIIAGVVKKIAKTSNIAAERADRMFNKKGRFLPVIIMTTQGDLHQAFMVGLYEALKRDGLTELAPETHFTYAIEKIQMWERDYINTYAEYKKALEDRGVTEEEMLFGLKQFDNSMLDLFKKIYPSLTSGSIFNPLVNAEILPMYKNIADQLCEQYGYSGIYIIFDEFSKFIEGQDKAVSGNNMKLLQDICELANASKVSQVYITMIAHKSIKEYGKYLSTDTINSFTGIEGRIKEILFVTSSKNNYELIKSAIDQNEQLMQDLPEVQRHMEAAPRYFKMAAFSSTFTKENFTDIVMKGCYPLSPISAYLLLNVSEKVAQNERTLFTFISKNEQYSMANYIANMPKEEQWVINADLIYDYFKSLFKKDASNELVHTEWLNAEYAISQATAPVEKKVLKSLAIINIINNQDELPANREHLVLASGAADADESIHGLEAKGLIYKKGSNNCYVFKTRATSQIKTEIQKRKKIKGDRISISSVLSSISDVKYILPKKYNSEYTMTRYFRYEFMEAEEFLSMPSLDAILKDGKYGDGKVIALFAAAEQDYSTSILDKMEHGCPDNLVLVYGKKNFTIAEKVQEYGIIQELKEDKRFFDKDENKVLEKELPVIEDDIEREIIDYLEDAFGEKSDSTAYYIAHRAVNSCKGTNLPALVDDICFNLFNHTVSINNELINKEVIRTAPIKKVRKSLIEILLKSGNTEQFLSGTSAAATIYRALFVNTGIQTGEYAKNAAGMLEVFDSFLNGAGNSKCVLKGLIDQLVEKPIGMRRGIIPIYLAYAISKRQEDIVVYYGDKEVPLTADMILNMCETPEDYSIFISLDDVRKEQYIANLCQLFHVKNTESYGDYRISAIVSAMQRWFRSLPQITKNIKTQPQYFNDSTLENAYPKFRKALQTAEPNPYEILFVNMPELFGQVDNLSHTFGLMKQLKEKLNGFYNWMVDRAIDATIKLFDTNHQNQDLVHTLQEWYEGQSDLAKHGLQSTKVTNLMTCIAENSSYDDRAFVEKLVKAVMEIYLDSWNDNSLAEYIDIIQAVKDETENIIEDNTVSGKYELSFIGMNGKPITRFYEPVDESKGALLRNILSDNLEDFSDMPVNDKIAILLEMIEAQLG